MASWQIKGLLLLASALVATALAASTSGAGPSPAVGPAKVRSSIATVARQPDLTTMVIKPTPSWHDG